MGAVSFSKESSDTGIKPRSPTFLADALPSDGIPVELFQILKDDAVKVLFGTLSSGHRTGKGQLSFQSQRKAMPKNAQTTAQLHSSHMLAK